MNQLQFEYDDNVIEPAYELPIEEHAERLRRSIINHLESYGWDTSEKTLQFKGTLTKDIIRSMHNESVQRRLQKNYKRLKDVEPQFIHDIARGDELNLQNIRPVLREVKTDLDSLKWDWVLNHTSLPSGAPPGFKQRFFVIDEAHQKIIGIIRLATASLSQGERDAAIGWDLDTRYEMCNSLIEGNILLAVPPYSLLLGGKLVALLATSNEIRQLWQKGSVERPPAAAFYTMSGYGKSSVYNRLTFQNNLHLIPVGYTKGFGTFHLTSMRTEIKAFYDRIQGEKTEIKETDRLILRAFRILKLPDKWMYHHIKRQIFLCPLAKNSYEFLRQETDTLEYHDYSVASLVDWWKERWMFSRAERMPQFRNFDPREEFLLWKDENYEATTTRQIPLF